MLMPLPFPPCPVCHSNGKQSFHRKCGCALQVEPDSYEVFCNKCGTHWPLNESKYYCSCGYSFEAEEVKEKLDCIVEVCKICAKQLELEKASESSRLVIIKKSIGDFIAEILKGLGMLSGMLLENIIQVILELWKKA